MVTESRSSAWPVLREPLLHFTLIGALIFAGHYVFAQPTQAITVTAQKQAELDALFEQRTRRKPGAKEHEDLVVRYADDEILFKEGLARGLALEDPGIRDQVVARMRSLLGGSVALQPATNQELEAFYRAHLGHYAQPAAVSFTEYVLQGEPVDTARALERTLRAGEPVSRASRVHRARSLFQLQTLYGPEDASRIFGLPIATWAVLESNPNPRVVRVDARTEAVQKSLENVIESVRADYQRERTRIESEQALKELRARFSVHVEGR